MTARTFSAEAKLKLTQMINEGMATMHEIYTLNGVLNDISDAYVFLEVALKKMSNCAKGSKAINKNQRQALLELYKAGKEASKVVKKIGMKIEDVGNIAEQPTPDASVPTDQRAIQRR